MSKTHTDQLKEAVETFDSIKDELQTLKSRLSDVGDDASKALKQFEGAEKAVKEMTSAIMLHEVALRKLYMGYTSHSIIADALIRYMAGYEKGDYTKELEKAADGNDIQLKDLEIKNSAFDVQRLSDIAQEIADAQADANEKQRKMRELSESTIVAPDGKPVLKVIK